MLTAEHELIIRKRIAEKMANVPEAGYVIPAPIFFKDKADFWAQIDALAANTKKKVETTEIAFCVITLLQRVDSKKEGCGDNPLIRLTYNAYFFRGYDDEREDQSDNPDEFLSRSLKSYNRFVKAILDVWTEFVGVQSIAELPEDEMDGNTTNVTQPKFIDELGECRYIRGVQGFSVDLQTKAEVLIYAE